VPLKLQNVKKRRFIAIFDGQGFAKFKLRNHSLSVNRQNNKEYELFPVAFFC